MQCLLFDFGTPFDYLMNSLSSTGDPAPQPRVAGHDPRQLFQAAMEGGKSTVHGTPPGGWEPPLPDEFSELLDGYEVTAILGRGGMGAVYRGIQSSLDREVAIKLLPPELGADPEFEARFRREAKAMARLNHPSIVQIYDFGQTKAGHYFFVMEFVDGTDLHEYIRSGRLDAEGAINAVSQICDALEYAHGEGYVHRDIKPANIFLNSKGIIKVGDFGLAKLVETGDEPSMSEKMGLTMTGIAMGTPNYIAPEQLASGGVVDHRADIYSLGIMFYEMLTGEVPRGAVKPPSQKVKALDVRIDGVVFKAMEHDPAERYQTATALRTDVDVIRTTPLQAGKPDKAPRNKAAPAKADPAPGKKNPALIAAVVLLPLLALGGWWLVQGSPDADSDVGVKGSLRGFAAADQVSAPPSSPTPTPNSAADAGVQPLAAASAHSSSSPLTLEAFLAAEPEFRPDPGVERERNVRLTPDRFCFLEHDGQIESSKPIEIVAPNQLQFRYTTGKEVLVTFTNNFRRMQRSDGKQPSCTFHSLGKPDALPIAAQIRLRESFSAPGRLEAIGSSVTENFLAEADGIDDFVQVCMAQYSQDKIWAWAALRADGRVVHGPGSKAKDPLTDIALIRESRAAGFLMITNDGALLPLLHGPSIPSDLAPVIDAASGNGFGLALHPDGTVTPWGPEFERWPQDEGLSNVISVSSTRYEALTLTKDGSGHVWSAREGYRTVAPPEGDPFVKVVGSWIRDGRFMTRSGRLVSFAGALQGTPPVSDIRYGGGPLLIQNGAGEWNAIKYDDVLKAELPSFTLGMSFATTFNGSVAIALRIVPAASAAAVGVQASAASASPGGAPLPPPAGTLAGLWRDKESGAVVPLPVPLEWREKPVVSVGTHSYGAGRWWAVGADGTVLAMEANQAAPGSIAHQWRDVVKYDLENAEIAVTSDGRLLTNPEVLDTPPGIDFVDAKVGNGFAMALRRDGTVEYWQAKDKTTPFFIPPPEALTNVAAIEATAQAAVVLKKDGQVVLWYLDKGLSKVIPEDGAKAVALHSNHTGVKVLYSNGVVRGSAGTVIESKTKSMALRDGLSMRAFRDASGHWEISSMSDTTSEVKTFAKALIAQSPAIDASLDFALSADSPKKQGVALWVEPSTAVGVQALAAPSPTSAANLPSGRLSVFGKGIMEGKAVPLMEPDDASDYVACNARLYGWQALRRTGDVVVGWGASAPDKALRGIEPNGLVGRQVVLQKDGSLHAWGDNLDAALASVTGVRLFDSAFRFSAAVFHDGSARIWNIKASGGSISAPDEAKQPTGIADAAGLSFADVVKVRASNCGVAFLRGDGRVWYAEWGNPKPILMDKPRLQDIDDVTNGFIGLTQDGRVMAWGASDHVEPPAGLPEAKAIRGGGRAAAMQKMDGTWIAWAKPNINPDLEKDFGALQEKLRTIRNPLDLDFYVDGPSARLVWIEPVSVGPHASTAFTSAPSAAPVAPAIAADDPVAAIETAFYDRFEPEVRDPHAAAVKRLDDLIGAALNRERAAATAQGALVEVLAWKRAMERLEGGQGVPSEAEIAAEKPPETRPAKLLQFYATYRAELAKLEAARDAKMKPLLDARAQSLSTLEVERTKAGDIDTALRAKQARETPPDPNAPRPATQPHAASPSAVRDVGVKALADHSERPSTPSTPATPALAAQLARYTIDYSRAGTLKVAGTILQNKNISPARQPKRPELRDVCHVTAAYEGGGRWMAVRQDGSVIYGDGDLAWAAPTEVRRPRWLDVGAKQAIAIQQDGMLVIWGPEVTQPETPLAQVIKVETSYGGNIALHHDGTVSVWGGIYESGYRPEPEWLRDVVDVAMGKDRAWVLKADGSVIGWTKDGDMTQPGIPDVGQYDQEYGNMRNLVTITGDHASIVGMGSQGRMLTHRDTLSLPAGPAVRVVGGYMLPLAVTESGRIDMPAVPDKLKRFAEAMTSALAARNVLSAAGGGDQVNKQEWGFIAWIEANP